MLSKKSFVSGIIVGCVMAAGSTVFASQNISAFIAGTHFKFDGVEQPLPEGYTSIGYNGHTYVPARFIAEQLGATVGFDPATNTVTINKGSTNSSPTEPNVPVTPTQPTNPGTTTTKITTAFDLQKALQKDYSSLETPMGTTHFTYTVDTNTTTMFPYDFWVQTNFDFTFYFNIKYSNQHTNEQKEQTKQDLKDFQQKIADFCLKTFPDKKIYGGYYYGTYDYPHIKVGYHSYQFNSWTNYDQPDVFSTDQYSATQVSAFQWYPDLDEQL